MPETSRAPSRAGALMVNRSNPAWPTAASSSALAQPRLALFDLDGTLADTAPDLADACNHAMRHLKRPPWPEETLRAWVGRGAERLLKRALTGGRDNEPDPDGLERALEAFLESYEANLCRRSRLFPGVREGLDHLQTRGIRLSCVTNKRVRFTIPLLEALGIRDDFDLVVGGDTLARRKPDPAPLLYAAQRLEVSPRDCLMIGDSDVDVRAARDAGMPVICVNYGYNQGRNIGDSAPELVVDSLRRLAELF